MLDKISDFDENNIPKNNKIIKALKGGLKAFKKQESVEAKKPEQEEQKRKMMAAILDSQ